MTDRASYIAVQAARFDRGAGPAVFGIPPFSGATRSFTGLDVDWRDPGVPVPRFSRRFRVSIFSEAAAAENAFEAGEDQLSRQTGTQETLSLLLRVYRHRGAINWYDDAAETPVFTADADAPDAGTPIAVLTSFGLPRDQDAFRQFGAMMTRVVDDLSSAKGMSATGQILPETFGLDGITFSLWDSEADMTDWAYRQHTHREAVKVQHQRPLAARTSFTRCAIEKSAGQWAGIGLSRAA